MRNASFNHDGSPAAPKGAIGPVDAVIGEGEIMAGLKVGFLEVDDIWVPVSYETFKLFYSCSDAICIPRDDR
ncbi:hypothetical protein TNCT_520391 [Trichonephila clavata]|uniref:Uncharacterized protein n=1 Tax=Trichonephila clavata TaxID=2740835 RepID=A0A8X6JB96_TRICU|nr:hypothetical protein TNCT_520391 [Trichonephila clavata]